MGDRKHSRDCNEEEIGMEGDSTCKRLRGLSPEAEELIHLLEDGEEEQNVAEEDVVFGVMKSLEEELSCCGCTENAALAEDEIRSRDVEDEISYLLRASDDELGMPPSPSVMDSRLSSYSAAAQATCPEILEVGLWHLEDYNWKWPVRENEEGQERDCSGCGSLFEVSEGDPAKFPM